MVSAFTKKIIKQLSRSRFQKLLGKMHYFILYAQGFGRSGDYTDSGEEWVVKNIVLATMTEHAVIFDVGANIGDYTKMLCTVLQSKKPFVHCFEPSARTFQKLQANIQSYSNVNCHNMGFGDANYLADLHMGSDSTQSTLIDRDSKHWGQKYDQPELEQVKIATIDSFCNENAISEIYFLKLDTEGFEYKVLEGAVNIMQQKRIQYIQFEFGVCMTDSGFYFKDFFRLLKDHYSIYRILRKGIELIEKYDERHEVFLTTNYLCIQK